MNILIWKLFINNKCIIIITGHAVTRLACRDFQTSRRPHASRYLAMRHACTYSITESYESGRYVRETRDVPCSIINSSRYIRCLSVGQGRSNWWKKRYSETQLLIVAINIVAMGYGGCVPWTNNHAWCIWRSFVLMRR